MVDAEDSKSSAARHVGSSPTSGTTFFANWQDEKRFVSWFNGPLFAGPEAKRHRASLSHSLDFAGNLLFRLTANPP